MPRCWTCGSAKVLSMVLIGPHGTPALLIASIQCAEVLVLVTSPMRSFSALRFCERSCGVACSGWSSSCGAPSASAEALEHVLAGGGDVDVAVAGREHAGRDRGRMIVAGLLGDLALHQPARGLEVEHEDLRFDQRGVDPLALAGALAIVEREDDRLGEQQARGEVGDRDADPHRAAAGLAGDRHQPAHALRDLVDAGARRVGAALAEARDRAVDDAAD